MQCINYKYNASKILKIAAKSKLKYYKNKIYKILYWNDFKTKTHIVDSQITLWNALIIIWTEIWDRNGFR